ncbi:hypothetical protein CQ047_17870 [Microbacterium sp. MYb72]|uniref:VG15 protein n=1 Tax=Microbacterium sp. MYb72 TaxID=1848693 RepID=UPI000CFE1414|nr:hypothetical protein [Microbacterium sp. MYb72]PRB02772.1 hypothetical protein CQ047_17870 [Microbacterium sp. MYb72]
MLLSQVDEHRETIVDITTLAQDDLVGYTASILNESPERVAVQVRAATPAVVSQYGETAAVAGALFYETNRPSPGFTADLARPAIGDQVSKDITWALAPLFAGQFDEASALMILDRLKGIAQTYVAEADRRTLLTASAADPLSRGIRRYATAGACTFCAYLSTMEAVTYESSEWHKHCNCVNVPSWEENPAPENPHEARWAQSAMDARAELIRLQHELKPDDMRWRNFYKARPDLTVTTKNILRLMRADLGLTH